MKKVSKSEKVTVSELKTMSGKMFEHLVKAVVDIEKEVMYIDAEMHFDQEQKMLEEGSKQKNLWGINLYPDKFGSNDFIEFDSMINLRPNEDNRSRSVEDPELREKIREIVNNLVGK
jgi:hypothetical protein